jgi:hypothetical protein
LAFEIGDGLDRKNRISIHTLKNRFLAPGLFCREQKPPQPPQSPPQNTGLKAPLVRLKPSQKPAEIKPPTCPHGVQLRPKEYEANCYAFDHLKKRDKPASFESVLFRASACLQCNPVCEHHQPMRKAEVRDAMKSGKRFSSECPACTNSDDPEAWERVLKSYGLPAGRGMAPSKFVISSNGATQFLGQQKNFQTGNSDIERRDNASTRSRDDLPAKSRKPKGYGSDDSPVADLRVREIQEIRDIEIGSVNPTCEQHGVNFCRKCFSKAEIQNMKEETAEAKQIAKREREMEEREDPPETDEELRGMEEGHGKKNSRETREIKEEFERPDPENEED